MSNNGVRHKVIYDYDATSPDELTIKAGQIVFVTDTLEKGWVRGYIGEDVGLFPAAYVEPDTAASGAPSSVLPAAPTASRLSVALDGGSASVETAQVIEEFKPTDSSQLTLVKDQLVIVFRKFHTGWGSGECMGKTGMFPLKNVRMLDLQEAAALRASTASPTLVAAKKAANKEKRMSRARASTLSSAIKDEDEDDDAVGTPATVLFSYTAADKGQLSLIAGETISVLDKLSGGWWKGKNEDGDVGFFPGSYVRESLSTSASSATVSTPPVPSREISTPNGSATGAVNSSSTNLKRASTISKPSLKKATALFKYVAKSSSELSFDVGDEVLVFPVKDGESSGWWTGALASSPSVVAHFPASYVKMTGGMGAADDSMQRAKEEKASKRKSQPANRGSSSTLGRAISKPPAARPPQRPGDDDHPTTSAPNSTTSSRAELNDSAGVSARDPSAPRTAPSSNGTSNGSADFDSLSKSTEQATKVSEQTKQGLIKLQQQSKTVFDGMLQRLDAADKDRQRLEHALREMHKLLQAGEAQRAKLAQQNQVLYQQVTDLKSSLAKESSSRASLEARISKLER